MTVACRRFGLGRPMSPSLRSSSQEMTERHGRGSWHLRRSIGSDGAAPAMRCASQRSVASLGSGASRTYRRRLPSRPTSSSTSAKRSLPGLRAPMALRPSGATSGPTIPTPSARPVRCACIGSAIAAVASLRRRPPSSAMRLVTRAKRGVPQRGGCQPPQHPCAPSLPWCARMGSR